MIFNKERKKAKEFDLLLENNKLKSNKEFASFVKTLNSLKEIKKQTPNIKLKPLIFERKLKVKESNIGFIYKLTTSSIILIVFFLIFSVLSQKEKHLTSLNQEVIAKELALINKNSPVKKLEIDQKIKKIIFNKENKKLNSLESDKIQKESSLLKLNLKKKEEVNDILNSL